MKIIASRVKIIKDKLDVYFKESSKISKEEICDFIKLYKLEYRVSPNHLSFYDLENNHKLIFTYILKEE